ncbi:MAG: UDP-N-acetylmuramoyl-tripeptide--D-alanyl-D-alanine ligase [Clostridia bacterium]|nr:UDP-N-acetylmuramoyl-tripeptide--D-alanyl-D-alanine ligase [Clostridia bacterium]
MKLTVDKIAKALSQEYAGKDFKIDQVVIDSRMVKNYTAFAAIVGERNDGHSYIEELDRQYDHLVFLGTKPRGASLRNPYFQVADIREALGALARTHLSEMDAKVIGVTGSVGKTTTKNFLLAALSACTEACATKGNQNNELGVPLTALSVEEHHRAAIIEMGMRGLGQISYLTRFAKPDIALITNVGVAHMELLGSRENIAKAKLELVDTMKESGIGLLNGDEPLLYRQRPEKDCRYFGFGEQNDYRAIDVKEKSFTLIYPEGSLPITLQVEGEHQIMNALAAFGAGHLLGYEPSLLAKGLERFSGDGRRWFIEEVAGITVIDDSYNASPDSMAAALKVLASKPARRVAVLGDMLELGALEEQGHQQVGALCKELKIDLLITFGSASEKINEAAGSIEKYHLQEREQMLPLLETLLKAGDTVLFKASNSMNFQGFAKELKERMKKE